MAEETKKLKSPATVIVVFEDRDVTFEEVLKIDELEDGSIILGRRLNNFIKINSKYLYYEVFSGED